MTSSRRRRFEQDGCDPGQIGAARALFREISRDDAHMAGLEQVANRLPPASRAAIEGNFDVSRLRGPDRGPAGIFMTSVDVQQPHAFEQTWLENRFR
ncbi:MAG: hypothetical protein JNM65_00885 [Verrucomicrobiaceae bacterium]|nr:hypothetical protein [Verrucomicrobiaceae bacterium]